MGKYEVNRKAHPAHEFVWDEKVRYIEKKKKKKFTCWNNATIGFEYNMIFLSMHGLAYATPPNSKKMKKRENNKKQGQGKGKKNLK